MFYYKSKLLNTIVIFESIKTHFIVMKIHSLVKRNCLEMDTDFQTRNDAFLSYNPKRCSCICGLVVFFSLLSISLSSSLFVHRVVVAVFMYKAPVFLYHDCLLVYINDNINNVHLSFHPKWYKRIQYVYLYVRVRFFSLFSYTVTVYIVAFKVCRKSDLSPFSNIDSFYTQGQSINI